MFYNKRILIRKKCSMKKPSDCTSIEEVRAQIDAIDTEIFKLFGERFAFVKEVVKYKKHDEESIIAADRRAVVLQRARQKALENNLDPDVFEDIYSILIEHFIGEELKIVKSNK